MIGSYEGEGLFAVVGGHEVVEAAQGGLAAFAAVLDPMNGDADDGPANDGQVEGRSAVADAAAVFAGNDVQAEV